MRLLDTRKLNFHEFLGASIPQYCILSHTWEDEEISYQEMLAVHSSHHIFGPGYSQEAISMIEVKSGYRKIRNTAEVARSVAYNFIWIDTCCIDKSSSAELREAINSMYQWYKRSSLCLAYLADVSDGSIDSSSEKELFVPLFRGIHFSIFLLRLNPGGDQYARIWPSMIPETTQQLLTIRPPTDAERRICYIRQSLLIPRHHLSIVFPVIVIYPITFDAGLDARWAPSDQYRAQEIFSKSSLTQSGRVLTRLETISISVDSQFDRSLNLIIVYESDNGACWCRLFPKEANKITLSQVNILGRGGRYEITTSTSETGKWVCRVRARREVINDQLTVSVNATVNFTDYPEAQAIAHLHSGSSQPLSK